MTDNTANTTNNVNHNGEASVTNNTGKEFSQNIRNIIIELLKKGNMQQSEHEARFKELFIHKDEISAYLRNINLKLQISEENGLAYIENLRREEEITNEENAISEADNQNAPTEDFDKDNFLIVSRKLQVFDTLVLLVIRKYYHERYTSGETTIVMDYDRIENMLTPYHDITASSQTLKKRIGGVLNRLEEKKLIKILPGEDEDRIMVSPLIRYVVNAEFMKSLLEEYNKLISQPISNRRKKAMANATSMEEDEVEGDE